ncbi:MAG: hypothetical protein ACLP9L_03385 [Thermoguttaceae bacterium]
MRKRNTTKQPTKTPYLGLRRIAAALLTGALAAAWIVGCSDTRNGSSNAAPDSTARPAPPALPAKSQDTAASATAPTAESVFIAWQQADKATAISRFVQVDWTARPLFAPNSVLGLSETQFQAIPNSSRQAKQQELLSQVPILKQIGVAVLTAGKDAAAKKDFASAKKYFTSLQQCGEALSGPDFTALVQQIGKFIKKMADEESAKLSQ